MDVVVIEAPTDRAEAEHVEALAAACSAALAEGRCQVGGSGEEPPTVRATLTFETDGSARIVVRGPGGDAERTLRFATNDAPLERWRSSGLVIGTVAEGLRDALPPKPAAPPPPAPPRVPPEPQPPPPALPRDPPPVWIDVGVTVGPALEDGSVRGGPVFRLHYGIASLPIAILVGAAYSYRGPDDGSLEVHSFGGGGGLAGVLRIESVTLSARAELVAHLLAASADAGAGGSGTASRWLPGGRFGAEAAWMLHRAVGPWLGLDFTVVSHGTQLSIRGSPVGRAPPYEVSPQIGVRAAFP